MALRAVRDFRIIIQNEVGRFGLLRAKPLRWLSEKSPYLHGFASVTFPIIDTMSRPPTIPNGAIK
jgi:hypothetical protein